MRDPDVRRFVLCAAGIVATFWTIGYGIPAAVILTVPEPLPKLARATEVAVVESWEGPGDFRQSAMLDELRGTVDTIQMLALIEVGIYPEITGCGRYQLGVKPDGHYQLRTANTGESHSTGGGIGP